MRNFILVLVLVLLGVAGAWGWREWDKYKNINYPSDPTIANIKQQVIQRWGDCPGTPDTCRELEVSISKNNDMWYMTAIYSGLGDDSVSAIRYRAPLSNFEGTWMISDPIEKTGRCARGENIVDFTNKLCP